MAQNKINSKLIIKSILLVLFAIVIIYLSYLSLRHPFLKEIMQNPGKLEDYAIKFGEKINALGAWGGIVYILLQILQIVVAIIPGEFVQIGGGYVFGVFWGTFYMVVGTIIGQLMVFYITRLLSMDIVGILVPQNKLKKMNELLNSPKSEIALFILFLIPGIPKDVLAYAAGFTPIDPIKFIVISLIARFPGLLGSAIIGANIYTKNYTLVTIIFIVVTILFVVGLLTKDRIVNIIHSWRK